MNDHPIRPRNVVAATIAIGGALIVALPQYSLSIVQIVIVTGSVVAGMSTLEASVPSTGWISPFKWMSPFSRGPHQGRKNSQPDEIRSIRSKLSGWRQPIRHGPPMPQEALNLLRPLIRAALDLDPENDDDLSNAETVLSPLAWGVLTSDLSRRPHWFQMLPPNKGEVAAAVHDVLDEIEKLGTGHGNPLAPSDPSRT